MRQTNSKQNQQMKTKITPQIGEEKDYNWTTLAH